MSATDDALERALADARRNQRAWDADADDYQAEHGPLFVGDKALAWGLWRIPESELRVLGDVKDRDVLELGCGAAQWSLALARQEARPVGLDISGVQLRHALAAMADGNVEIPLVNAGAERIPFADATFDIVFCDYGAMSFVDPHLSVPEAARVLRRGGLLAFSTTTPFLGMCWPGDEDEVTTTLHFPYFGLHRMEWEADETVDYTLPYGEWIRLFRDCGFAIDDLIEVQPPEGATTTFPGRPLAWSRKWPAEQIWKVRKE